MKEGSKKDVADKRHDAPKKGGKGGVKITSRVGGLPGTAGVKERKATSRAQRIARMEKSDRAV